jgi:excisionase family DNA binding protein
MEQHQMSLELLNPTEAGKRLGIGASAIRQAVSLGRMKAMKVSNRLLIPASEVEGYKQVQAYRADTRKSALELLERYPTRPSYVDALDWDWLRRYANGETYNQITETTDLTRQRVQQRIARAMKVIYEMEAEKKRLAQEGVFVGEG